MKPLVRVGLLAFVIVGCGDDPDYTPDAAGSPCLDGATECRADGLYTCDSTGTFQRTEACTTCEATPMPHCAASCSDAGVTSVCQGDSVVTCAGNTTLSCGPGTCLQTGGQALCVTRPGQTTCAGRTSDGTPYDLFCADGSGLSATHICDFRSGECIAAEYDCAALASIPDGNVQCDAATGHYLTSCIAGQPAALACSAGSACATDGSVNCYTSATAGETCGGSTVCYPGLHCTQTAAATSTCVQPAAALACNSTDVLAVCTDTDTGVACVNGAVWWWRNLTTWGGSCTNNHVDVPAGGTCIPGLADCLAGLVCDKSAYDVAGTCRTPAPNAQPFCTLTGQLSTGLSCVYEWNACEDGRKYAVSCQPVSVGGMTVTLCECSIDGSVTKSFGGAELCGVTTVEMLDQHARAGCGWKVTTVDVAQ